ncbi:hypothetical protein GCM10010505_19070 [Kitasatospora aburaviensis]
MGHFGKSDGPRERGPAAGASGVRRPARAGSGGPQEQRPQALRKRARPAPAARSGAARTVVRTRTGRHPDGGGAGTRARPVPSVSAPSGPPEVRSGPK